MVAADQAAIETAQTNLGYTSIVAPSDGRMGVRLIDPGNIVSPSDSSPIVTLTLTKGIVPPDVEIEERRC